MDRIEVELDTDHLYARPRRSCVQKEGSSRQESNKFSDDETESEVEDKNDKNDSEFRLGGYKKKFKKAKNKLSLKNSKKREKKPKFEAPSFQSVLLAQQKYEKKFEQELCDSESMDGDNSMDEQQESLIFEERFEEQPQTPQMKKKKIVIRPWNPGWYTIPQ